MKSQGQGGRTIIHEIIRKVPYEVYQKDNLGQVVERNLEFIEAGLKVNITPYPSGVYNILAQFDIEISNLETTDGLPVVSQRKSISEVMLRVGQAVEVARIVFDESSANKRKAWFTFSKDSENFDKVAIFAKRL